jgi:hypothetical protein
MAGDDAAEAGWVTADDVDALPMTDGTRAVIQKHWAQIHA